MSGVARIAAAEHSVLIDTLVAWLVDILEGWLWLQRK